jgi:hypothetical protein
MTTPFQAYSRTERGQWLAAIINDSARYPEYAAFSREGFPALTALVSLLRPELEPLRKAAPKEFTATKQFVGWAVGSVMRNHGHDIVGRARVPGRLFTMGAIWSTTPGPQPLVSPLPLPPRYLVHRHGAEILAPASASGA